MIKLCAIDDIPLPATSRPFNCKGFTIKGQSLFAVRSSTEVYIYRNNCPHLGVELNWVADQFLNYDGDLIHCSTHSALFEPETGFCISGPCNGENLQVVRHELRNNDIYIEHSYFSR